jgi:hypothetical protein
VASLITAALAPLAGPRPVDVAIADIDDPPAAQPAEMSAGAVSPWPDPVLPPA